MKLGIVLSTNETETVWNAFRFGVASLQKGHTVRMFLLGKGVESESMQDATFDVKRQWQAFLRRNGEILACGTCLKLRKQEGSTTCSISTMAELVGMVESSDRVVSFG